MFIHINLSLIALGLSFTSFCSARYDFDQWRDNGTQLMCFVNAPNTPPCTPESKINNFQEILLKRNERWSVTWPPTYLEAETETVNRIIGNSRSLARFEVIRDGNNQYKIDIAYEKEIDLLMARGTYRDDRNFWPWSEVAWSFFKEFYSTLPQDWGKTLQSLKGVVRSRIIYWPMAELIDDILGRTARDESFTPGKLREIKPPDDDFYALVGSSHGRSAAYVLFQHRSELGHKTIEKVEIWEADRWHSLIFRFKDYQ